LTEALLIKNGTVFDPGSHLNTRADLYIVDGKIGRVCIPRMPDGQLPSPVRVIDALGKIVVPGLIDMHVHLREPGREDEESVQSGCEAAAAGGFTAVAAMPNTDPVADTPQVIRRVLDAATGAKAKVYPIAAITQGRRGKHLVDMEALREAGAVAFSDDGSGVQDAAVMLEALSVSKRLQTLIIAHPEVASLSQDGCMNEGEVALQMGLRGIPRIAEEIMIARDIALAEYVGSRLHIAHISTERSVDLVREAKAKGVGVTCEVTPHHFSLTEEVVGTIGTNAKMSPPLRTAQDVAAIKEGLADGTIDAIASDHAPHSADEKDAAFPEAAFGIIGLETTLALVLTELVEPGILSVSQAIEKLSLAPARILGLEGGTLSVGKPADITIIDPEAQWTVDASAFRSKSRNSPFDGRMLKGRAMMTILDGVPA
jgi:dihydroorotase